MTTIFTAMPIFDKPGPLRDLLDRYGFTHERVSVPRGASMEESVSAMIARAPEMEFLLANTTPLGKPFFAAAKHLKLVSMFGVGIDHIDLGAATEAGVLVTNAPGTNTRCVSELAFSLMLALAHNVVPMHTDLVNGTWRGRKGTEISGKTLGLIGFGSIAQDMAKLGNAFGMRVIFANRTPRPEEAAALNAAQLPLDQVLAEADYCSVHVPGGANSLHLGTAEFAKMKKGAMFINTARGDIADLDALVDALTSGHLAGAGLDVFPQEPMDLAHPVFSLSQVVLTPHAGGLSQEAMERVTASALDEVVRVLNNAPSPNARNPEVYEDGGRGTNRA